MLKIGRATGAGLRGYLLFQGGLDVPSYLGSRSTFTLGGFGGHAVMGGVGDTGLCVVASLAGERGGDAWPPGLALLERFCSRKKVRPRARGISPSRGRFAF